MCKSVSDSVIIRRSIENSCSSVLKKKRKDGEIKGFEVGSPGQQNKNEKTVPVKIFSLKGTFEMTGDIECVTPEGAKAKIESMLR